MRIAVGGIEHESSNFSPVETPLDAFFTHARRADAEALRERPGDANTVIDGYLKGVRDHGAELVPLLWTHAPSGSQPTLETHETLKAALLDPLREALPVDGVLLSLHGAYSAEGVDDADGDLLEAVRGVVGPECPIFSVHDPHCNIGPSMANNATGMIIMDTYPHVDMAERALEATDLLVRTVRGEIRPTMGWRMIPLFWGAAKMISSEKPMRTALELIWELEKQPGVLTASIGLGYQWVDGPYVGASTVVITDDDRDGAQSKADELARWIWECRDDWQQEPVSATQALARGEEIGKYPIVLADQADNTGGGAAGDSTEILQLFVDRGLEDAAVLYVVDPETVTKAHEAGVGQRLTVDIGGKLSPTSGPPVRLEVEVLSATDGRFTYDGPMFANLADRCGDSALLKHGDVSIVVITEPQQPIDLAFCRTLGLDCRKLRYICVKSTGHFRSGFEPIAGWISNVDAGGAASHDFSTLPFKRLGRKIYPMDKDAVFDI